jgi:hypothetical protein
MIHRKPHRSARVAFAAAVCLAASLHGCNEAGNQLSDGGPDAAGPPVTVTMNANDPTGSGANTKETELDVSNVTASTFGKLWSRSVDGDQSAQPLYVGGLKLSNGSTKNVVFVATSHDSVYAFDADDPTASAPLWQVSVGKSISLPNPYFGRNTTDPSLCAGDIRPYQEAGITAAPAIDLSTLTLYVLALNEDDEHMIAGQTCLGVDPSSKDYCKPYTCAQPTIEYRLHALDLLTGAEKPGSPVVVEGSAPGAGSGSQGGVITFNAALANARVSLLLAFGNVYFATSSYNDLGSYHGWIFGYDATTLENTGVFCDTRDGSEGGIWQSGRSLLTDGTSLYVETGNGTYNANMGGHDYGDCALRLDPGLQGVLDYFTPFWSDYDGENLLDPDDLDLGSSGAILIPNTTLLLATGKMGFGYVIDRGNMGKWTAKGADIVQYLRLTWRYDKKSCTDGVPGNQVLASPVYWQGPDGVHIYVWGGDDYLRDYLLDSNGKFVTQGVCFCTTPYPFHSTGVDIDAPDPACGVPQSQGAEVNSGSGSALSVSSDGTRAGSAIVWATQQLPGTSAVDSPGMLEAYDATNVSAPIWSSQGNPSRDSGWNWAKYAPPTVANGHVYLPTFSKELVVYGLLK